MSRRGPRRGHRLLTLLEVAELMVKDRPRLAELSRKRKREYVLRQVRRVERLCRRDISVRVGREWFVIEREVDALRQWEPESWSEVDRVLGELSDGQIAQQRQINAQGAKLSSHARRISTLEEKEALTRKFLEDMQALDRRTVAARSPHARP